MPIFPAYLRGPESTTLLPHTNSSLYLSDFSAKAHPLSASIASAALFHLDFRPLLPAHHRSDQARRRITGVPPSIGSCANTTSCVTQLIVDEIMSLQWDVEDLGMAGMYRSLCLSLSRRNKLSGCAFAWICKRRSAIYPTMSLLASGM